MSDRRCALITALAIVLAPAVASAQQSVAAQRARLAVLEGAAAHADSIARHVDSVLQARRVLDTVRSGALRVITDSALARRFRPAVERTWSALSAHLGPDTALLREPFGAIARFGRPLPVRVEATALLDTARSPSGFSQRILGAVEANLVTRAGQAYRSWDGSLGLTTDTAHLFSLAYISLVTATSRAVRLCRAGDVPACAAALGLGPDSDRVATWYSMDDLRIVLGRGVSPGYQVAGRLLAACRAGNDGKCRELAALRGPALPAPLGVAARTSLVALAVARGGRGAYLRLLADTAASVPKQLASAARMPFGALVAAWRIRVLAAAPAGTTGAAAHTEWAAAGWIVVLIALGMRSSRWRRD